MKVVVCSEVSSICYGKLVGLVNTSMLNIQQLFVYKKCSGTYLLVAAPSTRTVYTVAVVVVIVSWYIRGWNLNAFPIFAKSLKHYHLCENHLTLAVFAKIIQILIKNGKFFQCSRANTLRYRWNLRENIFLRNSCRKQLFPWKFAKIHVIKNIIWQDFNPKVTITNGFSGTNYNVEVPPCLLKMYLRLRVQLCSTCIFGYSMWGLGAGRTWGQQ